MKTVYRTLALLIALGVVVQAAAIAFGTFGFINEVERGVVFTPASDPPNFGPALHAINGMLIIPALSLLLIIASFFAKVHHGIRWALLLFAVVAIQVNLGFFAFDTPAIGLIHGANAFLVLGLALTAARATSRAGAVTSAESEDIEPVPHPG
jgi:heme A synthase